MTALNPWTTQTGSHAFFQLISTPKSHIIIIYKKYNFNKLKGPNNMGKTIFNYKMICNGDEELLEEMKKREKHKRKNFFIKFLLLLSSIFTFNIIMFEGNTPEIKQENIYQDIYERTGN